VVRQPGDDEAGETGHTQSIAQPGLGVNNVHCHRIRLVFASYSPRIRLVFACVATAFIWLIWLVKSVMILPPEKKSVLLWPSQE
jgi:hypothetical protein